jgi:hypothetical protein
MLARRISLEETKKNYGNNSTRETSESRLKRSRGRKKAGEA